MDDQASAEQSEKLGAIFSGAMGGPMAGLTPLISENLGMEVASIEHFDDGRRHRLQAPGELGPYAGHDSHGPDPRFRNRVLRRWPERLLDAVLLGQLIA